MKNKLLIVALIALLCAGCDGRSGTVGQYDYTSNVRETAGGYIMYEIEGGTVTCREHKNRSEMSCWKN